MTEGAEMTSTTTNTRYLRACMNAHDEAQPLLGEMKFEDILNQAFDVNPELYTKLMRLTIHYNKSFCKIVGVQHPCTTPPELWKLRP